MLSSQTAAITMLPMKTCCQYEETPKIFNALEIIAIIIAPINVGHTPPTPPVKLVPPMITAAIAVNSIPVAMCGGVEAIRPIIIRAATEAKKPLNV